ncbi:MAG: GTP cyclohydrolase I [Candidatus Bathyarchaeia archaeon]
MNQEKVARFFRQLMEEGLGLDLSDPNLSETPERVARMYCQELLCNCCAIFDDLKTFPNTHGYDQIIVSDRIFFTSICSHHFLPFKGLAWLLYIPKDTLVGASKMERLVQHYACKPQLQENLCHEVIDRFAEVVQPLGAMVYIRAIHGCMKCRGVKQYGGSGMGTSAVYGAFKEDAQESKGLKLIELSMLDRQGE